MRLIFYGVSGNEVQFIKNWVKRTGIEVTILNEGISSQNVHEAKNHDGVCLFPSTEMRQSEEIYRLLHEYGIKQLSIKSTGVDGINFAWAEKYQLAVTNVPGYSPTSVGHFAVMSVLMMLRNLPSYLGTQTGKESKVDRKALMGREMRDTTVGILGTGRIGTIVAESLLALGAKVIATSSKVNPALLNRVTYVPFEELLRQSDVISIHVPLTTQSHYLFSDDTFAQMKDGALLVNTARGKIIDTQALVRALDSGKIAGAALDTLEDEELYFQKGQELNPFFQQLALYDNVMITPHIAYFTSLAVKEITETALDNARDMVIKGRSQNVVAV